MAQEYHAHVYFDASTIDKARAFCEQANARFELRMGRVHEKPVGPHPIWSCQLAFRHEIFADLSLWLALNRDGLVILIHPETGDEIADHTEHAIWMGEVMTLDLSALQ